ncbi:elongation factor P [Candidatus Sumerlaeota bacterium]|nr:elongation factor P [Candidatus Sumerlaeota bacterium]
MGEMSPTMLKGGNRVLIDGEVYIVIEVSMQAMGRGRGRVIVRMRHLVSGRVIERTFRSTEGVELADAEFRDMQYLYRENEDYILMDNQTYEQHSISEDVVGNAAHFLREGTTVKATLFEGKVIGVELPLKMDFEVINTYDVVKGDTATNVTKDATIDTGHVVKVPLFIKQGDRIRVNTTTNEYVERA